MANAEAPPELDARPQSRREWSGWLRSLVLPLGFVALIVAGLLYYESRRGDEASDDGYGIVALPPERNATGSRPVAEDGEAAPDFLLQTLNGGQIRLSDLQGRPVIVNFWATWCGPCRVEMPALVETYLENGATGLAIIAVDEREADGRVRPFVEEFGLPFMIAMDRRGEVGSAWRIGGSFRGLPSSYFLDRQGIVRKVVYGSLTAKSLGEGLALILGPGIRTGR